MTLAIADAIRNSMLDEITAAIDAGVSGGFLRVYDGVQPAKAGTVTNLLAEMTFSVTSFLAATGGSMTANAITDETSAPAAGTATWFRIVDSSGAFVCDGTVTVTSGGGDLELNTVTISVGLVVSVTSCVLTAGNA